MLNKKLVLIASLSVLVVLAGYASLIFGFGESWLKTINAIGCVRFGESCLMICNISIDKAYRLHGDVPLMVVKEHGTENVVIISEMGLVGTHDNCDNYEARPEVPCNAPYDVAIYINDTSGLPILTAPGIVCPQW